MNGVTRIGIIVAMIVGVRTVHRLGDRPPDVSAYILSLRK